MESVLRRFGLKKEQRESEARQKLQKDLFAFSKVCLPLPVFYIIMFCFYFYYHCFTARLLLSLSVKEC